eukprot:TRINITY_DN2374_c0_g1_i1.p1 TRINITY_DN2374_c0_g1~~TRINITY_DN2374_c0_g1_i1.p1  ORF type:complete len:303 (+),score=41.57 TRINITY_DN2374_c0_g1_i1:35-910(+)
MKIKIFFLVTTLIAFISSFPFQNDFTNSTALKNFYYAATSYTFELNDILNFNCSCCKSAKAEDGLLQDIQLLNNSKWELQGYMGVNLQKNFMVISFRGSTNLKNWILNIDAFKKIPYKNVKGCEVHSGFYDAYAELKTQIYPILQGYESKYPQISNILVTGHSLGAAIAEFCALDLTEVFMPLKNYTINVWSYGTPRIGNKEFALYYNESMKYDRWRIIHWEDIVPHLPTKIMGFFHCPREVWYTSNCTELTVCSPTNWEDPTCSDSKTDLSINDHLTYFNLGLDCVPISN